MSGVPLKISWALSEPWVPAAYGYHFDGVVAHVKVKRHIDLADFPEGAESFDDLTRDLPFDRYDASDGQWVWKASMLIPDVVVSERRMLTAKTPVQQIAARTAEGVVKLGRARVDMQRDYFKPSLIHYSLQHVSRVSAYCVGDPDRLLDYLSDLRTLGAKGRLGHGRIAMLAEQSFEMSEDPLALSAWKLRHMPDEQRGYVPIQGTIRTPYWRKDRYVSAFRPLDALAQVYELARVSQDLG